MKIKRNFLFLSLAIAIFFSSSKNFSQEILTLRTDRPYQTKSAVIIPQDLFQIETGFIFQKRKIFEAGIKIENDNLILVNTLCRYGINSLFKLRFGGEYFLGENQINGVKTVIQGLRNIFIGTKIKFRKDKKFITNAGVVI